MPRKKTARHEPRVFRIAVTDTRVSVRRDGPNTFDYNPDEAASTALTIEGRLGEPVVRMQTAAISVFRSKEKREEVGAALGISSIWQILAYLPDPEFTDLQAVILAGRLTGIYLVMESVRRGQGRIQSIGFHTRHPDDD